MLGTPHLLGWLWGLPGRAAPRKQPQVARPGQPAKPPPMAACPTGVCRAPEPGPGWPKPDITRVSKPELRAERLGLVLVTKGTQSGWVGPTGCQPIRINSASTCSMLTQIWWRNQDSKSHSRGEQPFISIFHNQTGSGRVSHGPTCLRSEYVCWGVGGERIESPPAIGKRLGLYLWVQ